MGVFDPGKGSKRRPSQVSKKDYDKNWDSINWRKGAKNEQSVSKQRRQNKV